MLATFLFDAGLGAFSTRLGALVSTVDGLFDLMASSIYITLNFM